MDGGFSSSERIGCVGSEQCPKCWCVRSTLCNGTALVGLTLHVAIGRYHLSDRRAPCRGGTLGRMVLLTFAPPIGLIGADGVPVFQYMKLMFPSNLRI